MTTESPLARRRGWRRRRPVGVDLAVVAVLLVGEFRVAPLLSARPPVSGVEAALITITLALVPLRHRLPMATLALTTVGASAVLLLRGVENVASFAPLLALYTVALSTGRRGTTLSWLFTAGVLTAAGALGAQRDDVVQEALRVLPWTAVVAAAGDGLRNRRAYLAAVEERAERAERSREDEARRRVAEERVHIARELHDVVAHHIAVVSLQAGVAQHLLATRPEAATDALAIVRRSAATVLEEIGGVLSVLREPGERGPGTAGSTAPAPGLARLEALVASFATAGLDVEWSLQGQPQALPPTVDLVAYRVLEEGMTNALKYGTGTCRVSLEYRPTTLLLRVVNSTSGPAAPVPRGAGHVVVSAPRGGTGHGLLGMRERATAVRGTLTAGPTGPETFSVVVELPLPARATS